jgi:hypothetical protein
MKQSHNFASNWVISRYVRTFVPIAMKARKGEIIRDGCSSVLSRDDVIHVKGPRIDSSRQVAVLAAIAGSATDFSGKMTGHELRVGGAFFPRAILALDCMMARKFPTCK